MNELLKTDLGETSTYLVGLKMAGPDIPGVYPAGNRIAASMLYHAIRAELDRAGILFLLGNNAGLAGPLNSVQMLFWVSDDAAALAIMEKALELEGLRARATLFKFHPGEEVFLPAGIDPARIGFNFKIKAMMKEKALDEAVCQQVRELFDLFKEFSALHNPPPTEPPGPIMES